MVRHLYKLKQFKAIMLDLMNELVKDSVILIRIALAVSVWEILK